MSTRLVRGSAHPLCYRSGVVIFVTHVRTVIFRSHLLYLVQLCRSSCFSLPYGSRIGMDTLVSTLHELQVWFMSVGRSAACKSADCAL